MDRGLKRPAGPRSQDPPPTPPGLVLRDGDRAGISPPARHRTQRGHAEKQPKTPPRPGARGAGRRRRSSE
eukprot:7132379-Lingulodinium_polyedra.AAC.1